MLFWLRSAVVALALIAAAASAEAETRVVVLIDDDDARSITRTDGSMQTIVSTFAGSLKGQGLNVIDPTHVLMTLGVTLQARTADAEVLAVAAKALESGNETLVHDYVVLLETKGIAKMTTFGTIVSLRMTADIYGPGGTKNLGRFEQSRKQPFPSGTSTGTAVEEVAAPLANDLAAVIAAKIHFAAGSEPPAAKPEIPKSKFSGRPHPMPESVTYLFTFVDFEPKTLVEMVSILTTGFPYFVSARPVEGSGSIKRLGYVSKSPPHKIFTWFHILLSDMGLPPGQKVAIDQPAEDKLTLTRLK